MTGNIVLVGAGQAGGTCALDLRKQGFRGRIILLGAEMEPPYERPSLSKEYLSRECETLTYIAKPDRWANDGIELHLGTEVTAIARSTRTLEIDGGRETLTYDRLVLATGGNPRVLPSLPSDRICYLRNVNDSRRIASLSRDSGSVVIIGAGVVGLEVAATLRKKGMRVTVVEAGDRVMARMIPHEAAAWLEALHVSHGVEVLKSTSVDAIRVKSAGVEVVLTSGQFLTADFCVVGIGMSPNDQLARACGLSCDDGILVDDHYRSVTDPTIYAVGDAARRQGARRDESWANAQSSAEAAALSITREIRSSDPTSYLWSTQFGRTLQVAGDVTGINRKVAISDFGMLYVDDGDRAVGVIMLDGKRDFQLARRLVVSHAPIATNDGGTIDIKKAAATAKERQS